MELITNFKDVLHIFNTKKMDDPALFGEIQKAVASAFNRPWAEDVYDNQYNYIVSIDKMRTTKLYLDTGIFSARTPATEIRSI